MYHEFASWKMVMSAQSVQCTRQPSSARGVGSIVSKPLSRMCTNVSRIQSTCCSIDTIMFDNTDGLPGPVIMYKLGKPTEVRPRYVSGPFSHLSFRVTPSLPAISTFTIAPVIASNPVAYTMASNSFDSLPKSIPVSVMLRMGCAFKSTSRTCGLLNVSK